MPFTADFLIVDDDLSSYLTDDKNKLDKYVDYSYLSRTDLNLLLSKHATLVTKLASATFGEVKVYKINWSQKW